MSNCHGSTVAPPTHPAQLLLLLPKTQQPKNPTRLSLSGLRGSVSLKRRVIGAGSYGKIAPSSYSVAAEEDNVGILACENGWRVRRMAENENEMRKVAQVQAQAFHEPVFLFDDLFFQFFQDQVFAALIYRLRNSPPDRYACLVAEPEASESKFQKEIVGVVDVTVSRDSDVLEHVQGEEEYLYVSGIAVSSNFRRQKVGTILLKACERVSMMWGFKYLALRAYESDAGARTLYANAGYRVVSGDPHWNTTWIGRKRRVLMIKQCSADVSQLDENGNL